MRKIFSSLILLVGTSLFADSKLTDDFIVRCIYPLAANSLISPMFTLRQGELTYLSSPLESLPELFHLYTSPGTARYQPWLKQVAMFDSLNKFGFKYVVRIRQQAAGKLVVFAIYAKETSEVVGEVGLSNLDLAKGTAEFFIVVGEQFWGTGMAPEAQITLLDYAFFDLALTEVKIKIWEKNIPQQKILAGLGLKPEANPEEPWYEGYRIDTFSLTSSDWPIARSNLSWRKKIKQRLLNETHLKTKNAAPGF